MKKKSGFKNRLMGRRQFLYGSGLTLTLPPLLSMMPSHVVRAATEEKKLRLVLLTCDYGMRKEHLLPDLSNLPSNLQTINSHNGKGIPSFKVSKLSEIQGQLSYVLDGRVDSLRNDLNLFRGLDQMGITGHGKGFLSGTDSQDGNDDLTAIGRSIDVAISESSGFRNSFSGAHPIIRTANYSHFRGHFYDRVKNANGQLLAGADNCRRLGCTLRDGDVFNKLFSGLTDANGAQLSSNPRRQLLIDAVLPDFQSLKNNRRLSPSDKHLLNQFAEGLFEVQSNIQLSCSRPNSISMELPAGNKDRSTGYNNERYWKNLAQMINIAFQCDLTRIFTSSLFRYDGHHEIDDSQDEKNGTNYQKAWLHVYIENLVKVMKDTRDPFGDGESLLDNSLVIWYNGQEHRSVHSAASIPLVTFGKLGGHVRTGYHFDYRQSTDHKYKIFLNRGYPGKMMLIPVMKAMGMNQAEINREGRNGQYFGDWKFNTGQFSWDELYSSEFDELHNTSLPYFSLKS